MTELLAPAGDFEKLKYAILYGADSVYLAGQKFGMRANAGNFNNEEMSRGIEYAHKNNVKVFVTVNIAARNDDLPSIKSYVRELSQMNVNGLIIADPGVIRIVKQELPDMYITLSTQANTTNVESVRFWHDYGVNRIVLARELSFPDIKEICENKPNGMDIEVFIHGAMCISYSGRCLLSNYMANRDSNRGECAQPCRWGYNISNISADGSFGSRYNLQEDATGSYILNSKDLCLIENVPDLIDIGVDSFKIEGRMKTYYYTACVTSAYRKAIDRYMSSLKPYVWEDLYKELEKTSHRAYTKAFFDKNNTDTQNYDNGGYIRTYSYMAEVSENTNTDGYTKIYQKNRFFVGDKAEYIAPNGETGEITVEEIRDVNMMCRESAPHPNEELYIKCDKKLTKYSLLRQKVNEK